MKATSRLKRQGFGFGWFAKEILFEVMEELRRRNHVGLDKALG